MSYSLPEFASEREKKQRSGLCLLLAPLPPRTCATARPQLAKADTAFQGRLRPGVALPWCSSIREPSRAAPISRALVANGVASMRSTWAKRTRRRGERGALGLGAADVRLSPNSGAEADVDRGRRRTSADIYI